MPHKHRDISGRAASAGADPEPRPDPLTAYGHLEEIIRLAERAINDLHASKVRAEARAQDGSSLGEHRCLTYSPSLDVERLAEAICGTLDPQPTYGFVDDDCRARARIVAAAYEGLGVAPEASEDQ